MIDGMDFTPSNMGAALVFALAALGFGALESIFSLTFFFGIKTPIGMAPLHWYQDTTNRLEMR